MDQKHLFDNDAIQPKKRLTWKLMLPLALVLVVALILAWHYQWDAKAVGAGVLLYGMVTNLFVWLIGVIGMVPLIGPLIVKVLSLSIIWLLNAVGYLVAYAAIKRGYTKDVLTYRGLTIALIIGIVIGYVLGHFL